MNSAQDSLSEPEGDGRCDADGREEGVGAAVVAGGDAAPVLEAAEHVLDAMALRDRASCRMGSPTLRLRVEGMHGAMPRSRSAARNRSLS